MTQGRKFNVTTELIHYYSPWRWDCLCRLNDLKTPNELCWIGVEAALK